METLVWILLIVLAATPFVVPPCVERYAQTDHGERLIGAVVAGIIGAVIAGEKGTSGHLRRAKAEGVGQTSTSA